MKKLNIDNEKCIGCGACTAIDPEHFDFDNEISACKVISQANIDNEAVNEAKDSCPVGAIEYIEGCNNEKCNCNPCTCGDNCECNDTCNCGDKCQCNEN